MVISQNHGAPTITEESRAQVAKIADKHARDLRTRRYVGGDVMVIDPMVLKRYFASY